MDRLAEWIVSAAAEIGIDAGQVDSVEILALAGEVRRGMAEPAAVVAVYLLGVAVGRGADREEVAARLAGLAARLSGSACDWRD